METTVSTNGRFRSASSTGAEKRAPLLMVFIGTTMNLVARYMKKWCGAMLLGANILSLDGTSQRDHPEGLSHLPDDVFLNLADSPGVQQRLRAALRNPRISEWMTAEVTKMNPGPGAGAEPLLARFLFEDSWDRVVGRLDPIVSKLLGPQRAETAANLRGLGLIHGVSYKEPVHVVLVASVVGGSVSLAEPVRLTLEHLFRSHQGEAKYELVLALPSVTNAETAAVAKRRKLAHARFQELADSFGCNRRSATR